jgi:signal transduction histidine kinase
MATWTADPVSGEVAWSDELYRMIGVDPHRFTPTFTSCWRLLDPSERARVRRLRRRLALSPRFRFTFQIVRPGDGVGRWLEVDGHKVGARGRMIGTARDVTVQRRAADRLRELDGQRRELLERMLLSEEEERGRIARALHDDTVQLMAALQINLDRIQSVLGGEPPAATTLVTQTRNALSDALERTRHLMFELRPQRFDRHGLQYAIGALCEQVGLEAGFTATIDVPERRFDGVIEDLCYRTVREAVINARKHSGADALEVGIRTQDGIIHGFVTDNGRGFDPLASDRSHLRLHMGLEAMAERLRLAGGSSEVASHLGEGCTVSFTIPYDAAPAPWEAVV